MTWQGACLTPSNILLEFGGQDSKPSGGLQDGMLRRLLLKKDFPPKTFIGNLTKLLALLMCPNRKHRPTSLEIVAMFDSI